MYSLENNIAANNLYPAGVSTKLDKINAQLKEIPEVLDKESLEKLRNDEYDITLEQYTDMTTYKRTMEGLYGNSSANKFDSLVTKLIGGSYNSNSAIKNFMDKMSESGISNKSARKLYSALNSYSIISNSFYEKNSFISAKI